jgi:hypothetical protein
MAQHHYIGVHDTSAVYMLEMLDPEYQANFNPHLPWLFDTEDEGITQFATEEDACEAQRNYRAARGFNEITGEQPMELFPYVVRLRDPEMADLNAICGPLVTVVQINAYDEHNALGIAEMYYPGCEILSAERIEYNEPY